MIQDYKTKSVLIVDQGLFTELARNLSESFGKVFYTSPWVNAFPASKDVEIGEGNAKIERVDSIAEVRDETDLFIFPDIYYGKDQIELVEDGKRVWGSREGDELEIYREDAKEHFKELGIAQGPYEVIEGGITALRKYIKSRGNDKLWIKIDRTRGDMETFCVEGYDLYKGRIDELEYNLGPKAEITHFVVEDHIKDSIDLAIDTFCINGQYPANALLGTEEKGEIYIGIVKPFEKMPPKLVDIYHKLSPTFKEYGYANLLSLESRATKKDIFLGDPCDRFGSPPSEGQLNIIDNLPDIFWYGAEGTLINPVFKSKYLIELMLHSAWADKHPLMVEYPKELREKIKFRYDSEFDGVTWIMPQQSGPRIGAIVEHGNNLDDLIESCKEISKQIRGIQIESFVSSFPLILEKLETLRSWGITF